MLLGMEDGMIRPDKDRDVQVDASGIHLWHGEKYLGFLSVSMTTDAGLRGSWATAQPVEPEAGYAMNDLHVKDGIICKLVSFAVRGDA